MLPPGRDAPITELLARWEAGDAQALNDASALLYQRLSELAHHKRVAEGRDHTLETSGLVHEVFLRLAGSSVRLTDRTHFFRLASRIMRNVLVDHARAAQAAKRGARMLVTLDSSVEAIQVNERQIESLHHAIEALAKKDPAKAQMIDLVYFGGLSGQEAAETMGMAVSSFYRELGFARAWLKSELEVT